MPRPPVCVARPAQLQLPLLHVRARGHFLPPPEEWALDKKNFSLTHYVPVPLPPKRAPPHPWRMVPAKRTPARC